MGIYWGSKQAGFLISESLYLEKDPPKPLTRLQQAPDSLLVSVHSLMPGTVLGVPEEQRDDQ